MASAQLEERGQAAPYGPRSSTAAPNVRPDCTGRGCRARRVGGRPAPVSDGGRWQSEARPRRSIGSSSARAIDFKGLYAKEQSAQSLNTLVGTNSSNALTTSRTADMAGSAALLFATILLPDRIRLAESTRAGQRSRRRQLSFVELVVAAAPNGRSHIDIADRRRHRPEFFE
jgi:hypothetical protein